MERICRRCKYSCANTAINAMFCMRNENTPRVKPNGTCNDWKPMRITHADKIRQISDEELAGEIARLIVEAVKQLHPLAKWKASDEELIRGTTGEMLDWLKQEVESDGEIDKYI